MSFSFDTKCEVCDNNVKNNCCKSAWLYGMILFAQTITPSKLKITTENVVAINLLNQLASEICGINFSIGENINSYFAYLDDERLSTLYDNFYIYNNDSISYSISNVITESTCCKYAFIKGAFLRAVIILRFLHRTIHLLKTLKNLCVILIFRQRQLSEIQTTLFI